MKSVKRGRASSLIGGIVGIVMSIMFFDMAMLVSDVLTSLNSCR